jgi:nucleoside-diphosphate-sugar epimerase
MIVKESILITGGAGYLGSTLVPALLKAGYKVTVLDNFLFSQNSLLDCCANPDFNIVRGDCRDKNLLEKLMKDVDVIIPLAAIVGAPACNFDQTAAKSINADAVQLILSLRKPHQKIIYPTTNSGYGIGEKGKFCTEETPLRPISLYGVTKVEAEQAVLDSGNSVTFRLATVFGMSPRMRIDLLVNDFVYRAVMDRSAVIFEGHAKRNFIHVRDVARAFLHALKNFDAMNGHAYNVGLSEANLSKIELCEEIKKYVPGFVYSEAAIGEDPDKRDYIVSNDKIESTGFKPEHKLSDGIQELIKGYAILRNSRYTNI